MNSLGNDEDDTYMIYILDASNRIIAWRADTLIKLKNYLRGITDGKNKFLIHTRSTQFRPEFNTGSIYNKFNGGKKTKKRKHTKRRRTTKRRQTKRRPTKRRRAGKSS
jgi:hypothetical protein